MLQLLWLLQGIPGRWPAARDLLAMACLGVAVAMYMQVLAFEAGSRAQMALILEDSGLRNLTIQASLLWGLPNRGGALARAETLTLRDVEILAAAGLPLRTLVPLSEGGRLIEFRQASFPATVSGTWSEYREVLHFELEQGRFIDRLDEERSARVAVLGRHVADELFGARQQQVLDPAGIIGREILVGRVPFTVVGVLRPRGSGRTGIPQDDSVYVPLSTAHGRVLEADYLSSVILELSGLADPAEAAERVSAVLRASHGIEEERESDFEVLSARAALGALQVNRAFFGGFFSKLSFLLMGLAGAGILAVSLLNAKDRDTEFGLRKAVGARAVDIMVLMLCESLLLALTAAGFGLLLGGMLALPARLYFGWAMQVDGRVLMQAVSAALLVSVAASLLPAGLAARRDPLQSLKRL